jgi:hypothetical protein
LKPEAEFLDEIQTKVLGVFLLAIHSYLCSFALSQLCLEISITQPLKVSRVQLLYTVMAKGGKPGRKPWSLPYGLRNPKRNLKSENSQDYAQKPQRNCMFMNAASGQIKRKQIKCLFAVSGIFKLFFVSLPCRIVRLKSTTIAWQIT